MRALPELGDPPKVLTIRQPWAWAVCAGVKDVENRTWRTNYRGRLLIHAGRRPDPDGEAFLGSRGLVAPTTFSAIIGSVEVVDVLERSDSDWWIPGHYAWVLADAELWARPVSCAGQQGLFRAPAAALRQRR